MIALRLLASFLCCKQVRGVRSSLTLALSSDVNKYTFSHSERNPCRVLNIRHGLIISAWTKALDQSEAIMSLRWMINCNGKQKVAAVMNQS